MKAVLLMIMIKFALTLKFYDADDIDKEGPASGDRD
jgi:hypothetical protein